MGLFSGLLGKGVDASLDIATAVMVPIAAAMLADGSIDDEEVRQIRSICVWSPIYADNSMERDTDIILKAIRIVQTEGPESSCVRVREFLSPALRETAFIFAVRMVFSDGHVGANEQRTVENLSGWLALPAERARMMIEAVSIMQHDVNA